MEAKQWAQALKLYREAKEDPRGGGGGGHNKRPDNIACLYCAAIQACVMLGEWKEARSILREMKLEGAYLDTSSYTTIVLSTMLSGGWTSQEALELFEHANDEARGASIITHATRECSRVTAMKWRLMLLQKCVEESE